MDSLLVFLSVTVSVGIFFVCRAIFAAGYEQGFRDCRQKRGVFYAEELGYWKKFPVDSFRKEVR